MCGRSKIEQVCNAKNPLYTELVWSPLMLFLHVCIQGELHGRTYPRRNYTTQLLNLHLSLRSGEASFREYRKSPEKRGGSKPSPPSRLHEPRSAPGGRATRRRLHAECQILSLRCNRVVVFGFFPHLDVFQPLFLPAAGHGMSFSCLDGYACFCRKRNRATMMMLIIILRLILFP